ncbi:MAG: type II toxin-antitoxin system RelE/ParE family toxin [Terriglobia bacterium]|jgi:toxin ParE1/3/4
MKLRFTPSGRTQFLQAVTYILQDNLQAARQFRKKAERALRRLTRFPASGRLIPEFPDLPFREIIISPYCFFYRCEDRTIWVVACWHGAQLPAEPMKVKTLKI